MDNLACRAIDRTSPLMVGMSRGNIQHLNERKWKSKMVCTFHVEIVERIDGIFPGFLVGGAKAGSLKAKFEAMSMDGAQVCLDCSLILGEICRKLN